MSTKQTATLTTLTSVQDAFIEKILSYDPKGYNYYALLTRANRKGREALVELGFTMDQAYESILDAYEVALHERSIR